MVDFTNVFDLKLPPVFCFALVHFGNDVINTRGVAVLTGVVRRAHVRGVVLTGVVGEHMFVALLC